MKSNGAGSRIRGFRIRPRNPRIRDPARWARYIADSLIETSIARDMLLLTGVDKPALLRRLFDLACRYSGQVLSYTKMLGQLQDAGDAARSRGSSRKLQVFNTAQMTVLAGVSPEEVRSDREFHGRLVQSAVGAHPADAAGLARGGCGRENGAGGSFGTLETADLLAASKLGVMAASGTTAVIGLAVGALLLPSRPAASDDGKENNQV